MKDNNKPKISVLISVFNEEKHLYDCIESVVNQEYNNIELIIIDDRSDDSSLKIIKSFNDRRIKVIINNTNIGLTKSLNKGLDQCIGKYIARIDGSDLMMKDRLKKQLEYLESNARVAVVGSYFKCINDSGDSVGDIKWPADIKYNIFRSLYGENPVGHPGVLMRRDIILKVGKYREKFDVSQDIDLWLRIYSSGYLLDNIPQYLTLYRINSKSISNILREKQIKNHRLAFHEFYYNITNDIDQQGIDKYLNNLLFKSKNICYNEINNIIKIFSILLFTLDKKLKIKNNYKYYYNQLGEDFNLAKYINFKCYKLCFNYFPHLMDKIIQYKYIL